MLMVKISLVSGLLVSGLTIPTSVSSSYVDHSSNQIDSTFNEVCTFIFGNNENDDNSYVSDNKKTDERSDEKETKSQWDKNFDSYQLWQNYYCR